MPGAELTGATFPVTQHNQAITLHALWQANGYNLKLAPGLGIETIYYKTNATSAWQSTSAAKNVSVACDAVWSAYATPKAGYTYTATTQEHPASGTMTAAGAEFAPKATAGKVTVAFNGNGHTTGSMSKQEFTVDVASKLNENQYHRTYRVNFTPNGAGASVSPTSADAEYSFSAWNNQADGKGTYTYANQQSITNPCGATSGEIGLYAQWTPVSVTLPEPTRAGHTFAGWYAETACTTKIGDAGASFTPTCTTNLYAKWQAEAYGLCLVVGTGIARIGYKLNGAADWTYVTATTDVPVDFGVSWEAQSEAKAGYTCSTTSQKGTIGVGGATYEPKATANKINIVFQGNGSTSGSTSSQQFTYNEEKVLSPNGFARGYTVSFDCQGGSSLPSKSSTYQFASWNNQADGLGDYSYMDQATVTNPCDATSGTINLYAQWIAMAESVVTLPTPSYAGHAFSGWYAEAACTTKIGDAGASFTPTNSVTLYAGWDVVTYTVTFYDDDPTSGGTACSVQQIAYGGKAIEPDRPTKQYYKFSAWNTDAWKNVTSDVQAWPLWIGKAYQVIYNSNYANGQTEEKVPGDTCGVDETAKKITLDEAATFGMEKSGYAFDGWETNKAATAKKWSAGALLHYTAMDKFGGREKVDFYAIWSPNSYVVRFDGNGATGGSMNDQAFKYDQAQALMANGFTREGQSFLHWHDEKNNADYTNGQIVSNLTVTAGGTVTLKAVWSNYHYVRFDRNGATNETEMALQPFLGAETNALSANVYGKVGYTFAGWATNAVSATNLVVTYTNCQAASFPLAQANETNTLYAVWATNRYTIAFDPGTNLKSPYFFGTMEPLTNCMYDIPVTIKCGYTNYCSKGLLGWSKMPGSATAEYKVRDGSPLMRGGDVVVSNLTADAEGEATLFAVWADPGELSQAVGLTNAVLQSACLGGSEEVKWHVVTNKTFVSAHRECIALEWTGSSTVQKKSGTWTLTMETIGAGDLGFCWNWDRWNDGDFQLWVDGLSVIKFKDTEGEWASENRISVTGSGLHTIVWKFVGAVRDGEDIDGIYLDDITWTSRETPVKPGTEMPTYDSKEAAEAAAATTRVVPPNDEVAKVVSAEDYNKLFEVRAVQKTPSVEAVPLFLAAPSDAGAWTLSVQLKPSVSNEVQVALNEAEANLCSVITNNPISVSVAMKAGLYYGLAAADEVEDLPAAVPANWVLGTGASEGQPVSAPRPSEKAAYYELRMSVNPTP